MGKRLTFKIPEDVNPCECKGCGALIYWIKPKDKPMPANPDGVSHFVTCRDTATFRKEKK